MEAKTLFLGFILFFIVSGTTAAQHTNTSIKSSGTCNQDSIRHVREAELRMDNYRQSPEDAQKIKALVERSARVSLPDSLIVINVISDRARNTGKPGNNLQFLRDSEGKYPDDIGLLKNNAFKRRLKNVLGKRYRFLKKNFNVQTPIEFIDGFFAAWGCQSHNCDATNFLIAYDFSNDVLHAGVREEGKEMVYSENGDIPAIIIKWVH